MKNQKFNLLVVAHPDDETIFFSSALMKLRKRPWHVVCVTDGNADGMGPKRWRQFQQACRRLGVKRTSLWKLPDIYQRRLDLDLLNQHLQEVSGANEVFTHGPIGEYGHPHHQDVSFAVHHFFAGQAPVMSCSYNALPSLSLSLTQAEFRLKTEILSKIYSSETQRFSHLLPATSTEGFVEVSLDEVSAIYKYIVHGERPNLRSLQVYKWYWPHLQRLKKNMKQRPF